IELYFEHGIEVPLIITPASEDEPEVEGQNVTDAEPVQNVSKSEVEVQNEPEVEVQNVTPQPVFR
ncbi:hypothetical protein A2U01_0097394, partial [Trifolium medium]|nr:hypothetical protein [Trifolium medium]